MASQQDGVLEAMMDLVEQKAKELAELKRTTNVMARSLNRAEVYTDVEESVGGGKVRVKTDQFYRKTPIVAAREYLEVRGEAVPPEEIVEALRRGGFNFVAQGWSEKDQLRLLAISLSKNSIIFHRLPNGTYGLVKWYGEPQKEKSDTPKVGKKKAPQKAKKAAAKSSARVQQKRGGASSTAPAVGVEMAVQNALGAMAGRFTIDDLLSELGEGGADRVKVGAEVNRLAQKGDGIRKVEKGALNKPAVYERTDTGGKHTA